MVTYYLALAFDTNAATDPQSDGTHYDAQYGFAVSSGSSITPLGPGSGGSGRQFEAVTIPTPSGNDQRQFALAVFTNIIGIAQPNSFVRVSFRPAHDVQPSQLKATSPLSNSDTQTLLTGVVLANGSETVNVSGVRNYGLPTDFYSTQWVFSGYNFASGQANGSVVHFEVTIEISISMNGSPYYFKVDPEMMIDF